MISEPHKQVVEQKLTAINYGVAIFSALGSFLFGFDSGIISGVISAEFVQFQSYFQPTTPETGAIVALFSGGAFFGAINAGVSADTIGRKRTIQVGALIALVGCILQTAAVHVGMMMAGRFIAGWGLGILSMICPLYQAEISPPHARGLLSGWTQGMISVGFFTASWTSYGCQFLTNDAQWRVPLALQNVPAILLLIGMPFLPFSPRWLVSKGRVEEAEETLIFLHGGRENANLVAVQQEIHEIVEQTEWENANVSSNFWDLFKTRPSLHRTICGCLVQICGQWSGVNVNAYYAPTIYNNLGYSGPTVLLIAAISNTWSLVICLLFINFLVDRIGRRQPLIHGAWIMACMLAWQAGIASQFEQNPDLNNSSMGIAGIASIFLFSATFSLSYGPVSWVYQSEVFSMPLRAMGASLSTCCNWAMNVLISQISPIAFDSIGYRYFIVFIATNLANTVIAILFFKETKGLTLEEIGEIFGDYNVKIPPTIAAQEHDAATVVGMDEEKAIKGVKSSKRPEHVEDAHSRDSI